MNNLAIQVGKHRVALSEELREGMAARRAGVGLKANPYAPKSQLYNEQKYNDWDDGYKLQTNLLKLKWRDSAPA